MHSAVDANQALPTRPLSTLAVSFGEFLSRYPKKIYKKGETILLQNETPKDLYVIESGEVKAYAIDFNGCERLVSFHSKKETLPIGFVFWLVNKSHYFYEAYTKCEIRFIPRNEFVCYMNTNTNCLRNLYITVTKQLLIMMNRIDALEQSTAFKKVALSLLYMPEELGKFVNKPKFTLAITQQEIASAIGLTRETTSIELKKMQKMHLIDYSRSNYIIYAKRLRKYLNTEGA